MLRVKVSRKAISEDFVAESATVRVLPARNVFAAGLIGMAALTFAIQTPSVTADSDGPYLSEETRTYLMAGDPAPEKAVELPSVHDLSEENYEDYDIPESQFALNPEPLTKAPAPLENATALLPVAPLRPDTVLDLADASAPSLSAMPELSVIPPARPALESSVQDEKPATLTTTAKAQPESAPAKENAPARPTGTWYTHEVQSGDSLSRIFTFLALPKASLNRILEATDNDRELALNIGDKIHFLVDENNILKEMVKPLPGKKQVRYSRLTANADFSHVIEESNAHVSDPKLIAAFKNSSAMPSAIAAAKERLQREEERLMARKAASDNSYRNDERPRLVIGQLAKGESFKKAGRRVGLTASEIRTIERELKNRYDLAKLGNGDSFRVLFNSIGTRALINAVEFQGSQGRYAIYRNPQDRGFYSEGEYVPTAGIFRRFPLADNIRISSKFNPHRRHPVTGRVTPHKGVDFRAPVGTPVYAPADGTVTFAGYQRAAGYYIIIRHTNAYSTVYMHLSKMDVRKGDHVYVGEVIARTGNTGRTTGPHLHYEVRVNDRAVDPLKIELPSNSHPQLAREQREAFESNVKVYKTELYTDSLASRKTESPES